MLLLTSNSEGSKKFCLTVSKTNPFLLKQPDFFPTKDEWGFKVYSSLKEYVDEFTLVEDVKLQEIGYVFRVYFAFSSLLLLSYLIRYLVNWLLSYGLEQIARVWKAGLAKLKRTSQNWFRKMQWHKRLKKKFRVFKAVHRMEANSHITQLSDQRPLNSPNSYLICNRDD